MSGSRKKKNSKKPARTVGKKRAASPAPVAAGSSALRSLDEEFADLEKEIDTIRNLPPGQTGQQAALLKKLRADWQQKGKERGDLPEWQLRMDQQMQLAYESLLSGGKQVIDKQGNLRLHVDGEAVQQKLAPVFQGLVDGLSSLLDLKNFFSQINSPTIAPEPAAAPSESVAPVATDDKPRISDDPHRISDDDLPPKS